eukprot:gnl/MRDRNA2_/MRDRNA2_97063_c0_seq1.p1 gnl/MRDRNA2_/MRDRNA2_97063_c0~~gnl/MRDRNA2_/MRDRNA2_97063_c0_seq1.p1  ORF type:complete len:614 (+),score=100.08 gnl/MRDRNA2_/MRDRNA2_97063_c0_seq1:240-1844(+)
MPREAMFTVTVSAVRSVPSKAEAPASDDVRKSQEMRVPENFSNIRIPSKQEDFPDPRDNMPRHDALPEDVADDDFIQEDTAPWDDPETGYQLLLLDNLDSAGVKVLGFENSLQVAQGAAPCPLTWPLGKAHIARAANCNSSVLAPARAPPALRDRRPRSAPSTRHPLPQPVPLAEEVRGLLRATPANLLLSPREAEYLEEEVAPRLAQKLRLAGTGSCFPNQYLASHPVQVPEAAETSSGYLPSRGKNAFRGAPPSMLHVNGVQMSRASTYSRAELMVTNASRTAPSLISNPFESASIEEESLVAPQAHVQRPTSAKIVHVPTAMKASDARRQRPASAPGARSSQQRPASAKLQQITVFQEARTAEKKQRPASALASYQNVQTENSILDESCSHQLLDATLDLGESFQASKCFNSFPPRARPQSRPQSAQSMPDCRQSVAMRGAQQCSPQVEFSAQAITEAFTLRTQFGFGSFPVKATERYCRRGRRDSSKVDRTASRAPALKRPSSAPAIRSGCGSKPVRTHNCRALLSRPKN